MGELIDVTDYTLVADPKWESRLKVAKETLAKRTIPAFIDFCKEVHEFRQHCDSSQGGSEFSKKGCEWLGCDSGTLFRWAAVGRRADELLASDQKLPISERAISDIASLDDIAFPKALEKVEPGMTQLQVKELIKEVDPPVTKLIDQAEKDRKTAHKLIDQFSLLPRRFQYVVWSSIKDICSDFE